MDWVGPVVMLVVGLVLGGAATWFVLHARAEESYRRAKAEVEAERAALTERLAARELTIRELSDRLAERERLLAERQAAETALKATAVQLKTTLEQERQQTADKLAMLEQAQQRLSDAFKALAAEALQSNNQSFLELAKATLEKFQETAKGDLEKRQQAIDELVKPVRETLEKFDAKVQEIERSREGAYQGLRAQVGSLLEAQRDLREQTANLVKALRQPQVRGRWGEIQLRRVVELAGMIEHCDFSEQPSTAGEDGQLRPDMLIHLPGKRSIVVDAKVPLSAMLEALEARDDQTRAEKLRDHVRLVRDRVNALGKKEYQHRFGDSLELVVLFLPGEVFFSAAWEQAPTLLEEAAAKDVIIATPTTLIALLRAVAYGWRQEQLAENARRISRLGQELHDRLAGMRDYLDKLGKSLNAATSAYNQAVGALEQRVLVSARRFKKLGAAGGKKELKPLGSVEAISRPLQAPELLTPPPPPPAP